MSKFNLLIIIVVISISGVTCTSSVAFAKDEVTEKKASKTKKVKSKAKNSKGGREITTDDKYSRLPNKPPTKHTLKIIDENAELSKQKTQNNSGEDQKEKPKPKSDK